MKDVIHTQQLFLACISVTHYGCKLNYTALKDILADKKNEEGKQRHNSSNLSLLQILVFQNYLMTNVSCVRMEGFNATTKRDSQLQLQLIKLLSPFSLLPKQKIYQCTKSSSSWTYTQKHLNSKNIVIVISLVASQRIAKVSR